MSDIRVGDQIRLSSYEGHAGLGTPEARSVFVTRHEGVVRSTDHSSRFGRSVDLDCSVEHDDLDENETHYLDDFEVERLNVVTCTRCDGRGSIQVALVPTTPADSERPSAVVPPLTTVVSAEVVQLRAEEAVEQVLRDHGIDPVQKRDELGAPWLATLLVQAVLGTNPSAANQRSTDV
jgi:hypothetical protein